MNIAIDYDLTWSEDPEFWQCVVALGEDMGHSFWIVTGRSDHRLEVVEKDAPGVPIISCAQEAKASEVAFNNVSIDVWIDDDPFNVCFPLERKYELDPA